MKIPSEQLFWMGFWFGLGFCSAATVMYTTHMISRWFASRPTKQHGVGE